MDATEILRAAETSKYIDSYPPLEIYTKAGPKEGTYIAYVYAELKFHDYDKPIPGNNRQSDTDYQNNRKNNFGISYQPVYE